MSETSEGRDALNEKFKFCKNLTKPDDQDRFVGKNCEFILFDSSINRHLNSQTIWKTFIPWWRKTIFRMKLTAMYRYQRIQWMHSVVTWIKTTIAMMIWLMWVIGNDRTFRNTLAFIVFCDALQALHGGVSMYSNYTGSIDCIDFFQAAGPTTNRFEGPFSFQLCSELAFPFCSRANDPKTMFSPFEWNMTEYSNLCYDKFQVRPDTQMVLTNFGEDRLKWVARVRITQCHSYNT